MHAGKAYDPTTMTLERFGFIGTDKKCFWGMVGVEWLTPLKIQQIKPGNGGSNKPKPTKPKPEKPKPAANTHLRDAGSTIMSRREADGLEVQYGKTLYHKQNFKKVYQATKNGWTKKDFNKHVINKGSTLHVIKATNGAIFGGLVPLNLAENPTKDFKGKGTWMFYIKKGVVH